MNELNRAYKVFKYFIREEGDICLDSCIPSLAEEFNPEMIYTVLNLMLEHVMECYPTFMRKVWNEEK
ncbi:YbjN domain-containing protein [Fusobacterium gonidiaformans]|uniref:YbjN domain-containing protein n=1 Tax=Fusobacterium gonidiaformans TaxID=849 RepID=UPI0009E3DAD2|nr:YbjN domain-containing protein [Fusobacterium gonidiaformans]AVQ16123.1 hypothetical protein C4N16_00475 [Fusobacterium gonidiaformans ATCC 25563]